jgi:hypothetical protein
VSAIFSPCQNYRYRLGRDVRCGSPNFGSCLFIMLNPSTADAEANDPTIRRCIGFADSWGYARLEVVNLFAWRSTDPLALGRRDLASNIGPDNDEHIRAAIAESICIVGGWGDGKGSTKLKKMVTDRGLVVRKIVEDTGAKLHHLGPLTHLNNPRHPLYLSSSLRPEPMP